MSTSAPPKRQTRRRLSAAEASAPARLTSGRENGAFGVEAFSRSVRISTAFQGIEKVKSSSCLPAKKAAAAPPVPASNLSPELQVVKQSKGPVMTVLEEFYKVGPGPSSSHTIGPMRITYDFYQRCTKLPKEQLDKATALKVHLFGSLSATGKGHGTERAALAGQVEEAVLARGKALQDHRELAG